MVAPGSRMSGAGEAPRAAALALELARSRGRFPRTAPSSITHPSPTSTPAWITAPALTNTPSAIRASGSTCAVGEISATDPGSRLSRGGGTARGLERPLKLFEHANHPQPALAVRPGALAGKPAVDEVPALGTQGLDVRDSRAPAPAGTQIGRASCRERGEVG